ncbi:MAG: UDP-N-acetylmuramoyl-tripeptide--D-alanyl-D-alanine ligase [Gammaproteobacteria bacterium]|nr:UDP-N-acetylmuramoyl-tripeptide--D-alanyl-D-alanine ligase [Gammaproteobacteria bacterium]MDH3768862.1 UDP-N-acetylmuramoyl-tripeptide--D-alanyl-D-alanine ligase [Gammaproteobacteria bacterium]
MSHGSLKELANIVGGQLHGSDGLFLSVSTDSRSLQPGELFIALDGPNFDGHDFVGQARERGAIAALVSRKIDCELPQILVENTLTALGIYAHRWRVARQVHVVAVTGSNGKTTVKDMITSILRRVGRTHATSGNLNNEIGVPLTLLALEDRHELAVIELGANHPGEIARLTAMAAPQVGLVTNAGPAHLEGFGSLDGVAKAKGELYEGMSDDGIAILNRDDAYYNLWRDMAGTRRVVTFGCNAEADFCAREVLQHTNGHGDGLRLLLETPDGDCVVKLPLPGQHNGVNAAAAAAAAWARGADNYSIIAGLQKVKASAGRLAIRTVSCGARLIDDTYNANPGSMQVALDFLAAQPGKAWLVLGDMGELGEDARALHAHIGERAKKAGVERLFVVGPLSAAAAESFGPGAERFGDTNQLIATLRQELHDGVNLLVKASRAMHLEHVTDALTDEELQG